MTDAADRRASLEERFAAELTWRDNTASGVPPWYAQLLTDLVLATGEEEIRYFSAKYVPAMEDAAGSMAVVAFTDDLVTYASLDTDSSSVGSPLEVTVTARKSLNSFSLESLDAEDSSLASVRITVQYPQFSRSLPLAPSEWARRDSETAELIACLRRDLVA